jgi:hypothetical protein
MHQERSVFGQFKSLTSRAVKRKCRKIRTGRDMKVIFDHAIASVHNEINAIRYAGVLYSRERRNLGYPLSGISADEIMVQSR